MRLREGVRKFSPSVEPAVAVVSVPEIGKEVAGGGGSRCDL